MSKAFTFDGKLSSYLNVSALTKGQSNEKFSVGDRKCVRTTKAQNPQTVEVSLSNNFNITYFFSDPSDPVETTKTAILFIRSRKNNFSVKAGKLLKYFSTKDGGHYGFELPSKEKHKLYVVSPESEIKIISLEQGLEYLFYMEDHQGKMKNYYCKYENEQIVLQTAHEYISFLEDKKKIGDRILLA